MDSSFVIRTTRAYCLVNKLSETAEKSIFNCHFQSYFNKEEFGIFCAIQKY
jgi:hypothetical protein